jgi:putative transcriptional regulator
MKSELREKRTHRDMTQQSLAEACEVSRQTIISIETGRYEPSTRLALKLARVLKCRVEDLFELEEND